MSSPSQYFKLYDEHEKLKQAVLRFFFDPLRDETELWDLVGDTELEEKKPKTQKD